MAPYPFGQGPTTGQVIERFVALGCELAETAPIRGPRGEGRVRYLRRPVDGRVLITDPLPDGDDDPIGWEDLRRLCRRVLIDPRRLNLGLDLG